MQQLETKFKKDSPSIAESLESEKDKNILMNKIV
jgi:hypothetical protein